MASDDDFMEGSGGQGFDPRELLRTARDYWLLALILALPGAIGYYFWKKGEEPVFRSSTLILFEVKTEQVMPIEEVLDPTLAGGGEAGMQNYLAHLQSRVFLEEVVDALTEEEVARFVAPYEEEPDDDEEPADPVSPLGLLSRGLGIKPAQGTTVALSLEHRNAQTAAMVLNRVVEQFTIFLTRRAARANDAAIKFLTAEADELRQQVRESDMALQNYREDKNVISLADSQNLIEQKLARVSEAASSAYLDRVRAVGILNRSVEALERGDPIAKIPAVMSYVDVREVLAEINRLESEISVLGLRYGGRHPTMVSKQEVLKLTRQRLEGLVDEAVEYLQGQARAAMQLHESLVAEQGALERESLQLDRLAIEFNVLQRRLESQKTTYDRIISRLNETIISSKLVQAPVRVVDSASVPGRPIRPNRKDIMMTSGGLFGLVFAGVIGAFAFLDRRIRSSSVIEEQLEVELLGEVPDLKGVREKDRSRVVSDNLEQAFGEAYRSVAGKIMLAGRLPCPKSILFTSSSPGEGKSLLCFNLAWSMREQGKRILLVNADFRAPALDDLIVPDGATGMSEWYQEAPDPAPVRPLDDFRLGVARGFDFLAVGMESVRPQEILSDERFRSALHALSRQYDYTLVDAPPGLVFHDAISLADWATETVVVVRYLNSTVARLKRLLKQLEKTRSRKLGVVLNAVPAMQSNEGYYRHARRYYEKDNRRSRRDSGDRAGGTKNRSSRVSAG